MRTRALPVAAAGARARGASGTVRHGTWPGTLRVARHAARAAGPPGHRAHGAPVPGHRQHRLIPLLHDTQLHRHSGSAKHQPKQHIRRCGWLGLEPRTQGL